MLKTRPVLVCLLLLLAVILGGCDKTAAPSPAVPEVQAENPQQSATGGDKTIKSEQDMMTMTVYYATKDAMNVMAEKYIEPKNSHPAQTAVELLIAGPKNAALEPVVPAGTKLRNISIKDHIAYVDFNDKLVKNNNGGSTSEILLVAAIVNTLTEFHDIQKVQILVEGKKIDTISGHMDIGEPLSRSEKIIKK